MKMRKIIGLCLALILMVASLGPIPVSAESYSGHFGENITWVLENGTLTISGTGPMGNAYGNKPWHKYDIYIRTVVIEEGITTVGADAFNNCRNLKRVSIPSSVTEIHASAFEFCTNLTEVSMPPVLTVLGVSAFWGCSSLESIVLPLGLTSISASSFGSCTSLTSISIPYGVSMIYSGAFDDCTNLTTVSIPETVAWIDRDAFDGCGSLELVRYGGGRAKWNRLSNPHDPFDPWQEESSLKNVPAEYRCIATGIVELDEILMIAVYLSRAHAILGICVAVALIVMVLREKRGLII